MTTTITVFQSEDGATRLNCLASIPMLVPETTNFLVASAKGLHFESCKVVVMQGKTVLESNLDNSCGKKPTQFAERIEFERDFVTFHFEREIVEGSHVLLHCLYSLELSGADLVPVFGPSPGEYSISVRSHNRIIDLDPTPLISSFLLPAILGKVLECAQKLYNTFSTSDTSDKITILNDALSLTFSDHISLNALFEICYSFRNDSDGEVLIALFNVYSVIFTVFQENAEVIDRLGREINFCFESFFEIESLETHADLQDEATYNQVQTALAVLSVGALIKHDRFELVLTST